MNKVLINELQNDFLKTMISSKGDKIPHEDLIDLFTEYFHRNMHREHLYFRGKALEVLDLGDTLEEATRFMLDK